MRRRLRCRHTHAGTGTPSRSQSACTTAAMRGRSRLRRVNRSLQRRGRGASAIIASRAVGCMAQSLTSTRRSTTRPRPSSCAIRCGNAAAVISVRGTSQMRSPAGCITCSCSTRTSIRQRTRACYRRAETRNFAANATRRNGDQPEASCIGAAIHGAVRRLCDRLAPYAGSRALRIGPRDTRSLVFLDGNSQTRWQIASARWDIGRSDPLNCLNVVGIPRTGQSVAGASTTIRSR